MVFYSCGKITFMRISSVCFFSIGYLLCGMLLPAMISGETGAAELSEECPPMDSVEIVMEQIDNRVAPVSILSEEEQDQSRWEDFVGHGLGIWVSVSNQQLRIIKDSEVVWTVPCSTAEKGVGSIIGSFQTPLGWHRIREKIGKDSPKGQVFRAKRATAEIWNLGDSSTEDLVLTRVLTLEGMEPGLNKGKDSKGTVVDSFQRYIYIHGTNDEDRIGSPASHGCVRLLNDDVIFLFDEVPQGTLVYIGE